MTATRSQGTVGHAGAVPLIGRSSGSLLPVPVALVALGGRIPDEAGTDVAVSALVNHQRGEGRLPAVSAVDGEHIEHARCRSPVPSPAP